MNLFFLAEDSVSNNVSDVMDTVSNEVSATTKIIQSLVQPILNKLPDLCFSIVFLIIAYLIVKQILKVILHALKKANMDHIMISFIQSIVKIILYVLIVVIALSVLGVPMTSIITVIASAGVAIGLALKDSLSNLAGGFILLFAKPMKAGDLVEVNGITGKIASITILYTKIITPDNSTVYLPNGLVSGGKIINLTEQETRRVDLLYSISYETDINKARTIILDCIQKSTLTLSNPTPEVHVSEHGDNSIKLKIMVWCKSEDYWNTMFYLNEAIKIAFDANKIEIPYPQLDVHMK